MSWILAGFLCLQSGEEAVRYLQHKDPTVRRAGADAIGGLNLHAGVLPLIELLRNEEVLEVRSAAVDALRRVTGKTLDASYADWRAWWDREGKDQYSRQILTNDQIRQLMQPHLVEMDRKTDKAKSDIRTIAFISGITAFLFLLVMIFFVANVSSKLKEWRGLVARADQYVKAGEELTQRTDRISSELEGKKAEIMAFVGRTREESESEIERYGDMISKNLEHKIREEMMVLRQKAEKELVQTLGELRTQVDVEIRRLVGDQKEKIEKAFAGQREVFLKEVQAHTLFLEAGFHALHRRHDEALRKCRELVALKPDHVMGWNSLGVAQRELLRFDEALEAFQKALELSPNNSTVFYNVAGTYARLRKKDKMLEALTLAIANDGEFKDEALNDPAFREYWNDPAFKDIAEG